MYEKYPAKTCPYCQFPIKYDSEVVVCRDCKIPHHKECWEQNGGCTTFGCIKMGSEQEPVREDYKTERELKLKITNLEDRLDRLEHEQHYHSMEKDKAGFGCDKVGLWQRLVKWMEDILE